MRPVPHGLHLRAYSARHNPSEMGMVHTPQLLLLLLPPPTLALLCGVLCGLSENRRPRILPRQLGVPQWHSKS